MYATNIAAFVHVDCITIIVTFNHH